jgi:hypothetical protein
MTPPIYKRGKLDPSEYGKVVSMAEHASHWRFAMGVTCLVVFRDRCGRVLGSVSVNGRPWGEPCAGVSLTPIKSGAARCRSRPNFRQGGNDDCYPVRLRASAQEESICVHFA